MVDFEEKMKDIISDYYSTIGKFNNVSNLISLELHEINENDSEEIKRDGRQAVSFLLKNR